MLPLQNCSRLLFPGHGPAASTSSFNSFNLLLVRHSHYDWSQHRAVKVSYKLIKEVGVRAEDAPIAVLHGLLGSSTNWASLARVMSKETGRPVYLPDARNHGQSPHADSHNYFDQAADLRMLFRDLGLKDVTLIGHSMGARTAMLLSLLDPDEYVRNLCVVDASPMHMTTTSGSKLISDILGAMKSVDFSTLPKETGYAKTKQLLQDELQYAGVASKDLRMWLAMNMSVERSVSTGHYHWLPNIPVLADSFEKDIMDLPGKELWRSFDRPTKFIGGEKSDYIPRDAHDQIRKLFPLATFEYVPNAGHWVHSDNPKEFMKRLLPFIRK